jgi:hypothetical protein
MRRDIYSIDMAESQGGKSQTMKVKNKVKNKVKSNHLNDKDKNKHKNKNNVLYYTNMKHRLNGGDLISRLFESMITTVKPQSNSTKREQKKEWNSSTTVSSNASKGQSPKQVRSPFITTPKPKQGSPKPSSTSKKPKFDLTNVPTLLSPNGSENAQTQKSPQMQQGINTCTAPISISQELYYSKGGSETKEYDPNYFQICFVQPSDEQKQTNITPNTKLMEDFEVVYNKILQRKVDAMQRTRLIQTELRFKIESLNEKITEKQKTDKRVKTPYIKKLEKELKELQDELNTLEPENVALNKIKEQQRQKEKVEHDPFYRMCLGYYAYITERTKMHSVQKEKMNIVANIAFAKDVDPNNGSINPYIITSQPKILYTLLYYLLHELFHFRNITTSSISTNISILAHVLSIDDSNDSKYKNIFNGIKVLEFVSFINDKVLEKKGNCIVPLFNMFKFDDKIKKGGTKPTKASDTKIDCPLRNLLSVFFRFVCHDIMGYYGKRFYGKDWQGFKGQVQEMVDILDKYRKKTLRVDIDHTFTNGIIHVLDLIHQFLPKLQNTDAVPIMGFNVSMKPLVDVWNIYNESEDKDLQLLLQDGFKALLEISIEFLKNYLPPTNAKANNTKKGKKTITPKDTEKDKEIQKIITTFAETKMPNYHIDKILDFVDGMEIPDVIIIDANMEILKEYLKAYTQGNSKKENAKANANTPNGKVKGNGNANRPNGNGNANRPNGNGNVNRVNGNGNANRVNGNGNVNRVNGNGNVNRVNGNGNVNRPNGNAKGGKKSRGGRK